MTGNSTNSTGVELRNTSSGGHDWSIATAGSGSTSAPPGALEFYDNTAATTRLFISPHGDVGIGTNSVGTHSSSESTFAVGTNASIGTSCDGCVAIGVGATVNSGTNAGVALGYATAGGNFSVAIGQNSMTGNTGAIALGGGNALAQSSVAAGPGTIAQTYGEIALGTYNVGFSGNPTSASTSDPILEVGVGTSSGSRVNAMTILKNGNVGIGTTAAPSFPLQVTSGSSSVTTLISAAGNSPNLAAIDIKSTSSNHDYFIGSVGNSSFQGATGGALVFYDNTNSAIRMMVSPTNGYVGVGTTAPAAELTVNNNSVMTTSLTSQPVLRLTAGGAPYYLDGGILSANGYPYLQGNNSSNGAMPLVINPFGGSVAIGTTAPSTTVPLTVAGNNPSGPIATITNSTTGTGAAALVAQNNSSTGGGATIQAVNAGTGPTLAVGSAIIGGSALTNMSICTGTNSSSQSPTSTSATSFSISCSGAAVGSSVNCSPSTAPSTLTVGWNAYVTSASTITVAVTNTSSSGSIAASTTWKCLVAN